MTSGRDPGRIAPLIACALVLATFATAFYNDFSAFNDIDIAVGATNSTEGIIYTIDKAQLIQATPHNVGRERLLATVEIEGYHSPDAVPGIQIVVSNNDAAP